jgi:pimeloyl-ACP methyl ester carboxylesterase
MDHAEFNDHRTTVSLAQGEMSFADIGRGPVALFVHGVFTSSHLWRNVIGQVAGERRCVAIDLLAHGRTELRLDDVSLLAQSELLEEFCQALGMQEVDLVANDTGGAISQIFMANHPERVRTATFTNCDVHDQIPPESFRDVAASAAAGTLAPALTEIAAHLEAARETVLAQCYEDVEEVPIETIEEFLGAFADPRRAEQAQTVISSMDAGELTAVEPQLAALEIPTLIAWGTGDVFFDVKWAYWLRDAIAGARKVVEIAGGRLFWPDERADELVPHLREHWATHALSEPSRVPR